VVFPKQYIAPPVLEALFLWNATVELPINVIRDVEQQNTAPPSIPATLLLNITIELPSNVI